MTTNKSADVSEMVPSMRQVCIPGDVVLALGPNAVVGLGDGLLSTPFNHPDGKTTGAVVTSKYCAPVQKEPHRCAPNVHRYFQERPAARRYLCSAGDPVIGIVIKKMAPHYYYLYIGGTALIYMDGMAFDGASKTSHPRLQEGALVYGFIKTSAIAAPNLLDPSTGDSMRGSSAIDPEQGCADSVDVEMSCAASELGLPPKEWTSGEAIFGPLEGGRLLTVPLSYARSLQASLEVEEGSDGALEGRKRSRDEDEEKEVPASYLVSLLGQHAPFEICVGMNGLVWVKGQESASSPGSGVRRTIAVCACIMEGQNDTTKEEMRRRVERYFPK